MRPLTGDILLQNVVIGVDSIEQRLRVIISDQHLPRSRGNTLYSRGESLCSALSRVWKRDIRALSSVFRDIVPMKKGCNG